MPNANYEAGRRLEYHTKKVWEAEGFIVLRSAGSKGPFDLIALPPARHTDPVYAIQCKKVQTQAQANRLGTEFSKTWAGYDNKKWTAVLELYVGDTRSYQTLFPYHKGK